MCWCFILGWQFCFNYTPFWHNLLPWVLTVSFEFKLLKYQFPWGKYVFGDVRHSNGNLERNRTVKWSWKSWENAANGKLLEDIRMPPMGCSNVLLAIEHSHMERLGALPKSKCSLQAVWTFEVFFFKKTFRVCE